METIQAIFSQLGANSSVVNQIVIVFVFYFICKYVFFNKLQFMIENREEKTTKLESSADETFEKANKLGEKYKSKIEAAHSKAQSFLTEKKSQTQSEMKAKLKNAEEEVNTYVENSKDKIKEDIKNKRNEILAESNQLANLLINKLTGKH
jgi:F0F1-type ATP synthase membrane subunit b/b'